MQQLIILAFILLLLRVVVVAFQKRRAAVDHTFSLTATPGASEHGSLSLELRTKEK